MKINQEFQRLRLEQGWNIPDLVEGITTVSTLTAFENGERDLAVNKLQALLARMGITLRTFAVMIGGPDTELEHWQVMGRANESAARLKHRFTRMAVAYHDKNSNTNFYRMMVVAGEYYYVEREQLVTDADIDHLTTLLVASGSWDESQLEVLHAVMVMLPSPKVLVLTREVLQAAASMRAWNQMSYLSAWTVVVRGLRVLVARRSRYATPLFKEIYAIGMDDHLLEARYAVMMLERIVKIQAEDTTERRQALLKMYKMIPNLQGTNMEIYFKEALTDTLGMTVDQLAEPVGG